jgi:Mn-dependent DtxR family transcriptional regulator
MPHPKGIGRIQRRILSAMRTRGAPIRIPALAEFLGEREREVSCSLVSLRARGLVSGTYEMVMLTPAGQEVAGAL